MTDSTQSDLDIESTEAPLRSWRPSGHPAHRAGQSAIESSGAIVEQMESGGLIGAISRYLKRPFVRLLIGLGIFILGAIIYDTTVNYGSWTERDEKPKATKHRGAAPVPKTPD